MYIYDMYSTAQATLASLIESGTVHLRIRSSTAVAVRRMWGFVEMVVSSEGALYGIHGMCGLGE